MKNVLPLFVLAVLFFYSCDSNEDESNVIICGPAMERCDLVPNAGFCKAYIPKYYFDKTDKRCKEFIWGGCNGVVPFDTMEECRQCEQAKRME